MDGHLPFFVTEPGSPDVLMGAIGVLLLGVLLGAGALYFTVQAIPERMASGSHKIQMQLVGILGVLSLFTMNNAFWVAGLLLAAIPFHELLPAHYGGGHTPETAREMLNEVEAVEEALTPDEAAVAEEVRDA